jgi:TonB family protein
MRRLLTALALFTGCACAQQPDPLHIEPQYSDEARLAGLEGSVLVAGTISNDGSMQNLRVSRPLGLGLDEQAIAAAAQLRFAPETHQPVSGSQITVPIDFALPSKQSHWHLVAAEFKAPAGASRPTFAAADYPLGSGLSLAAYDEAGILAVIDRGATVTMSFDIDQSGSPKNFQVVNASLDVWGPEAVRVVQSWRFHPGMKAGAPVSVPCTLTLVWGPEDFNSKAIANQVAFLHPPPPAPSPRGEPLPASAIVSRTEPEYTDEARQAGVEGTLVIQLSVDEQGNLTGVRMADTPLVSQGAGAGLAESAMKAVKQWRFKPRLLNGQPTSQHLMVQVDFRLSGVESSVFSQPPAPVKVVKPDVQKR